MITKTTICVSGVDTSVLNFFKANPHLNTSEIVNDFLLELCKDYNMLSTEEFELKYPISNPWKKESGYRSHNPFACNVIEEYGKDNGYDFQHARNGGEYRFLTYWVDGYDKEKNVVIEYYETAHRCRYEQDLERINKIKKELHCKIIILREWDSNVEIIE